MPQRNDRDTDVANDGAAESTAVTAPVRAPAEALNLKITDLRTFIVDTGGDENFVFVKIYTNQGLVGLGDGSVTGM